MQQTAFTAEDVFSLYERNSSYYNNCKLSGKICPNDGFNGECYCQMEKEPVLPITIGDQCVPCDIKRKVYIKQGEECSICLDSIFQKNNAYLTSCGHSFHKLCLFKAFEAKAATTASFACPLCRARLGYPEFYCRYTSVFKSNNFSKPNHLDNLEEFWLSINFQLLQMCNNGSHPIGMKSTCKKCIRYRKTGM
jgi:hypothetical protein